MHVFPLEYWKLTTLFANISGIATLLSIDELTRKRTLGHLLHVQIDLNMSHTLHDHFLVEREGYVFFVELEYESLPIFLNYCVCVGHSIEKCWKLKGKKIEKPMFEESTRNAPKNSKQTIPINDSMKNIENDEYINVIGNDTMNDDFVDLYKEENHTLETAWRMMTLL